MIHSQAILMNRRNVVSSYTVLLNARHRGRDFQKGRLYRAERFALENDTLTLEQCEALVRSVTNSASYRSLASKVDFGSFRLIPQSIAVKDGRRRRNACGGWGFIKLPRWSRRKLFVLHEVAHAIFPQWKHWPEMAGVYLWLAEEFAPESARLLYRSMESLRVRSVPIESIVADINDHSKREQ